MTKTIKSVRAKDKQALKAIKSVQASIPLDMFYEDGIFLVQKGKKYNNKFAATFQIRDIAYLHLSEEMQKQVFFAWSAVLNSIDPGATAKLSVIKHKINSENFTQFLAHSTNPQYSELQKDYNKILMQKASQGNGMIQEVYITISVNKKDYAAAKAFFIRTASNLKTLLFKLGSACHQLNGKERLELLRTIYRSDKDNESPFDLKQTLKTGSSAKNYIAPESMEFESDFFKLGAVYGRALVLHSYPTYLKDSIVNDLCELNSPLIWSMDIIPVPTDEAVREAENRAANVEQNIAKYYQKQYNNKNYSAEPTYDMRQQREQAQEYLTDLTERDQHLMYVVVTMVHFAESKEKLEEDTESLMVSARTAQCKMDILRWQQLDGLNTALPLGVRRIEDTMTLTTEGVAGFMPFKSSEIQEPGGYCFGQNQLSKNLIMINPQEYKSQNSILCGMPGGGKSFAGKWIILSKVLSSKEDNHEIIIIDPEREYTPLVKALGGEVIVLSRNTGTHINPLDLSTGYVQSDNPITNKAEFMLSLCEQILFPQVLGPKEKSLIDRCTEITLRNYVNGGCVGDAPTLKDFYNCLKQQPEEEAHQLALGVELYATGTLSTFSQKTNVDIKKRVICFDIHDLDENLRSVGMLVLFDHIQNRMIHNRAKGVSTSIINDEFYTMLQKEYTSQFFYKSWKRGRKYGCDYMGITQNVEDFLRSPNGRAILSTSELIIMLTQSPMDCAQLSELLNISENLQEYITNAKEGSGLVKFGSEIIPFENDIPSDTLIYKLLTTKPNEAIYSDVG